MTLEDSLVLRIQQKLNVPKPTRMRSCEATHRIVIDDDEYDDCERGRLHAGVSDQASSSEGHCLVEATAESRQ